MTKLFCKLTALLAAAALAAGTAALPATAGPTTQMGRIAAGNEYSLFVDAAGDLYIFGRNFAREKGESTQRYDTPTKIMSGVKEVAAGANHYAVLKKDGSLWTAGNGEYGELGDGRNRSADIRNGIHETIQWKDGVPQRSNTVRTQKVLENITAISAGTDHTLALDKNGNVWATGRNQSGQLGDGTTTDRAKFAKVKGLSGVKAISAGKYHNLALTKDGDAYVWGGDSMGALGDGRGVEIFETENYGGSTKVHIFTTPQPIMSGVRSIAAGAGGSFMIRDDGELWACGSGLGDGRGSTPTPTRIMDGVQALSPGMGGHVMLIKTDGSVWAWGLNTRGQVGNNSATDRVATPVQVADGAIAVSAGGDHSLLIKADGTLWTAGNNRQGQLGNGKLLEIPYQTKFKKIK